QVQQLPNVTIVDQTHISGLVADDSGRRVTGIRIRRNDESLVVAADFVVDASGRSSRTGEWLGELGYPKPPVDCVEIDLAYTTRTFRRRPGDLDGDMAAIISPTPPHARIGFIL